MKKGDAVTYTIFHSEPEVDFRYKLVYEDEHLLAISKSGNIPVHACGVYIRNTLIGTLKNIYGENLNLAHRLDRETSGLTLLTKDARTARVLGNMFAKGDVSKLYTAVVHGKIREASFEVNAPIGKFMEELPARPDRLLESDLVEDVPRYATRRRVDFEGGKPAATRFEVERYVGGCTIVRAIPLSGRTNQIRVHLDYAGHPIVGDKVYKPRASSGMEELIHRHALHCRELRFMHPVEQKLMHLEAPYPEDFVRLIEALERTGRSTDGSP